MSAPLRVLGDERSLALAGPPAAGSDGPAVHLGAPTGDVAPGDLVWLAGPSGGAPPAETRLIATSGEGLWNRALWPVSDDLFGMAPPAEPLALVVGADDGRRSLVTDKLDALGLPALGAPQLTVADLRRASVVALLGEADAATPQAPWTARALPAEAPAVLATGRLLVAPRCAINFGLLPGGDHLAFGKHEDVVAYLDSAIRFPDAFDLVTVVGAIVAERHRASVVYARLATELAA